MTDKEKIEAGEWVDCWLCKEALRLRTETSRYCYKCERGFCPMHGSFRKNGPAFCMICGLPAQTDWAEVAKSAKKR